MRIIERPPQLFRALFPGALFRVPGGERGERGERGEGSGRREEPDTEPQSGKEVYLTFDDGPIPEVTPLVLDLLDEYGAKATFFMVGQNVERNPQLLEEVRRRGHAAGNHTHRHLQGMKVGTGRYLADVAEADSLIGSPLFRPPHGLLRPSQLSALRERYRVVMYDLVTRDYDERLSAERIFDNVRALARPGSVIVFHDSVKSWPRLREALPRSLEWLLESGYTLPPMEESAGFGLR